MRFDSGIVPRTREGTMHIIQNRTFTRLLSVSVLWLGACATAGEFDDGVALPDTRSDAIEQLGRLTGAPVTVEIGDTGVSRVIQMTPRFPVASHVTDPAVAAQDFLTT